PGSGRQKRSAETFAGVLITKSPSEPILEHPLFKPQRVNWRKVNSRISQVIGVDNRLLVFGQGPSTLGQAVVQGKSGGIDVAENSGVVKIPSPPFDLAGQIDVQNVQRQDLL